MGKYKPWDYIPNQNVYSNRLVDMNSILQQSKVLEHNQKQMKLRKPKKKHKK